MRSSSYRVFFYLVFMGSTECLPSLRSSTGETFVISGVIQFYRVLPSFYLVFTQVSWISIERHSSTSCYPVLPSFYLVFTDSTRNEVLLVVPSFYLVLFLMGSNDCSTESNRETFVIFFRVRLVLSSFTESLPSFYLVFTQFLPSFRGFQRL